jgi:hypothetical protein
MLNLCGGWGPNFGNDDDEDAFDEEADNRSADDADDWEDEDEDLEAFEDEDDLD